MKKFVKIIYKTNKKYPYETSIFRLDKWSKDIVSRGEERGYKPFYSELFEPGSPGRV